MTISDCANTVCKEKATHGAMYCFSCNNKMRGLIKDMTTQQDKPSVLDGFGVRLTPHIDADKIVVNGININPPKTKMAEDFHDKRSTDAKMSFKYPKYYKQIPSGVTELDIYMVCHMFQIQDYSGALHHAIKKILLPGVRTGGKSRRDDIKEARDTLTRWLEIHP